MRESVPTTEIVLNHEARTCELLKLLKLICIKVDVYWSGVRPPDRTELQN